MEIKIKDMPIDTQAQKNAKSALSVRAKNVALNDEATEKQVEVAEAK